jgi:hypothetical protein
VPLNHPTDSLRHSFLTCPHAGVWRKLTEGWAALNSRCRSASIVRTERATGANVIPDAAGRWTLSKPLLTWVLTFARPNKPLLATFSYGAEPKPTHNAR